MKRARSIYVSFLGAMVFFLLVFGNPLAPEAQTSPYLSKSDAVLDFLILQAEKGVGPSSLSLGRSAAATPESGSISVSIRFDHVLTREEIADIETLGVVFVRINGEVAHSGPIYGAQVTAGAVNTLTTRSDVLRIESTWKPNVHYPLHFSIPDINADYMWLFLDGVGNNVTGKGITVADFDTGIDVFHPDFWYADGGSYSWIDTNSNGRFDPGIDAVDLNGNGMADSNELLNFFDAQGGPGTNDGVFQASLDWLYNDANRNGRRDYGTGNGFTEASPTYGERIFIVDDTNKNNALDPGENVLALGTSKVARTMNTGTERIRGTDLILSENDTNGHGTSVCMIINGGVIGKRKYVGVAPDAELLVSHGTPETVYIPWARTNGAKVMLYEFGSWVQEFLDGSSNLEQMVDAEAAAGIVQVVPAGNLGGSNKHADNNVAGNGSTNFTFSVPSTDDPNTAADERIDSVYITALWRTTGNNLAFTITTPTTPTPSVVNLPASPGDTNWHKVTSGDNHTVWYRRENSSRGTAKYDIAIERNKVVVGGWTLQASNGSGTNEHVDMYIADNRTSWSGGAVWTSFQSNQNTITSPATADSAIVVAAYDTRGGVSGDLAGFSPEGPRIDGRAIMDIAAPGVGLAAALSKDVVNATLGSYRWFSGTSPAGPHVAGASALLLQLDPTLNHNQVQTRLQQRARTDGFTGPIPGPTPDEEWGYGKLDVLAAAGCTTITCAADITQANDPGQCGATVSYGAPTVDDSCPFLCSSASGSFFPVGTTNITCEMGSASCSFTVTVSDIEAPAITCPADITQSNDPGKCGAVVTFTADVHDNCSVVLSSCMPASGSSFPVGTTTVTCSATDKSGNTSTCSSTVTVNDTEAPTVSNPLLSPALLWPPDHKMRDVIANYTATDNCSDLNCFLSATSNEPVNGTGDGDTSPDWEIVDANHVRLRAERAGTGDGRIYTVPVTCTDASDNTTTKTATAVVPHNMTVP